MHEVWKFLRLIGTAEQMARVTGVPVVDCVRAVHDVMTHVKPPIHVTPAMPRNEVLVINIDPPMDPMGVHTRPQDWAPAARRILWPQRERG